MTIEAASMRMAAWLERAWLERYLDRHLSAEEEASFEAYILDKPDLLVEVESDLNLRDAVAATNGVPGFGIREDRNGAFGQSIATKRRGLIGPLTALAATLVLGAGIGRYSLNTRPEGASVVASPARISFYKTRGDELESRVEQENDASTLMILDFVVDAGASSVTFAIDGATPVPLKIGKDGYASALIPRDELRLAERVHLEYTVAGVKKPLAFAVDPAWFK